MKLTVSMAVPLRILELKRYGGPTDLDWDEAREIAQEIAEKGDILQFQSEKKGESGRIMGRLIRALAIAAFVPGGIRFCDMTFEANPCD
jgi:hypothetical protein